LQKTQTH